MVAWLVIACGADATVDNAAAVDDVRAGRAAEVTVQGPVLALLADGNGSAGPHQRFDLDLGSGVVVEVDHNLTLASRVPLHVGDTVTVHGQFEPDPGHPIIHDTHHAIGAHEAGWIDFNGQRYE